MRGAGSRSRFLRLSTGALGEPYESRETNPRLVANATAVGQAQIRDMMAEWVTAACAKDVNRLISLHAPDVVLFDVGNPLQYDGLDAATRRMKEWFSFFQGPVDYEIRDLTIAADEDVGFCHGLHHVNGTSTDGTTLDMWWRATVVFASSIVSGWSRMRTALYRSM